MSVRKKIEKAGSGGIWSVSWANNMLVTGSVDGSLKFWQHVDSSINPEPISVLPAHSLGVIQTAIDSSKKKLASSSLDHTLKIFDFNSDHKEISSISADPIEAWGIDFSQDGNFLASSGQGGNVTIWNIEKSSKEQVLSTGSKFANDVCYSPDGRYIAVASLDGLVSLFDATEGKKLYSMTHSVACRCLRFSADSSVLFVGSDDKHIKMYDAHNHSLISSFSGHASWVLSVDPHEDSKRFVSSSSDRTVKVWDIGQRSVMNSWNEHEDQVWCVKIAPAGDQVASVSADDQLILYDL